MSLCSAMILAAGRGERMRPLTDTCPKPLLKVKGLPLMHWQLRAMAQAGIKSVVVNTGWLGQKIHDYFRGLSISGNNCLLSIQYSDEVSDLGHALETAGGIVRAMPQLDDVFWVVAGDVFAPDFVFGDTARQRFAASGALAHLWLVPNPPHKPQGDFGMGNGGLAHNGPASVEIPNWTFSTIGLYKKAFFQQPWCGIEEGNPQGIVAPLAPMLRKAMEGQHITAEVYHGRWTDVGTPERLKQLNEETP